MNTDIILIALAALAAFALWQSPALLVRAISILIAKATDRIEARHTAALIAAADVARDPWGPASKADKRLLAASFRNAMLRTEMRSLLPQAYA